MTKISAKPHYFNIVGSFFIYSFLLYLNWKDYQIFLIMTVCERVTLFRWFKITWEETFYLLARCKEKLIINNNSIKFSREPIDDILPYDNFYPEEKCKWSFNTDDENFEEKLNIICIYFLNHREKYHKIHGQDAPMFTIEVKRYDGTTIKEDYYFNMRENEMDKLIDYLMDFIPKNAQVPYFIDGYPLDDEE